MTVSQFLLKWRQADLTERSGAQQHFCDLCDPFGHPRLEPCEASCAQRLKKRIATDLYTERPTWLALAHQKLDAAVFAAYGWHPAMGDEEILEKLLALNLERSGEEG